MLSSDPPGRRLRHVLVSRLLALFALTAAWLPLSAADWPEYLGGPERAHFSPLRQITRENVSRLQPAWEFHTGDLGEVQCNPLIVGGVLYGVTAANAVFALNAATGEPLWRFEPSEKTRHAQRGLAYWSDPAHPTDTRILFTQASFLCAIDARTGRLIPGFGDEGRVSLRTGLGESAQKKWVGSTSPGTVIDDLIVMPTRVTEDADAAPGFIQAFNLRTGKLAWIFRTIPSPGQPGYETWSPDAYKNVNVGSANSWPGMSVDRARGILYVPTGSASPDFWGGDRLGNDLYANCLLALDAHTGKLRWHFQFVHHDLWDRDLPAPPNLVTITRGGRKIDAVAQITKSGTVFVFERDTGRPIYPIREHPVPASELTGEQTAPTQPWPDNPRPFARQSLTEADLSPIAENRAELLQKFRAARRGWFQPFSNSYDTVLFPGYDGGGEWGGAAVSPGGILYVNANEIAWIGRLKTAPTAGELSGLSPGHRNYVTYCASCHGPDRLGHAPIPSLVDLSQRRSRDEVSRLIVTGKGMMPGIAALSESERARTVDFLFGTEKTEVSAPLAAPDPGANPRANWAPYKLDGYVKFLDSQGYPAISPPWGTLTAIDLNTGKHLWQVTLGEFKALSAKGVAPTGTQNYGGPALTASGLLFIAATQDGQFRAFDVKNGKLLWQAELPAAGFATPAIYEVAGKQYVVVAAGGTKLGAKKGDSYIAFSLP
jgi:quinoprotein glucose dehydrogenase